MPKRYKVREVLKLAQRDGRFLVEQTGSHRHFKHETKKGRVTIAGKPGDTLHPKTAVRSSPRRTSPPDPMFEVPIVIEAPERPGETFSAYASGLPGVVATGQTEAECAEAMRTAVIMHLRGMVEDGDPIPATLFRAERVDVVLV